MQGAIQACIDISSHIISSKSFKRPEDLGQFFDTLHSQKVIDKELANSLKESTGMRNILVHSYLDVDEKIVYKAIQNNLEDFDKFIVQISKYLENQV